MSVAYVQWRASASALLLHAAVLGALALPSAPPPPLPEAAMIVPMIALPNTLPQAAPALPVTTAAPQQPTQPKAVTPVKAKAKTLPAATPSKTSPTAETTVANGDSDGTTDSDGGPPQPVAQTQPSPPAAESFIPPSSQAAYLNNPPPPYPILARRRGLEGVVVLAVWVDDLGQAQSVSLHRSSGHAVLDQSALETVKTWRFVPARRGGHTVAAAIEVPIRFALNGAG